MYCGEDNCGIPGPAGEDCFAIPIKDDPYQADTCMYFARSEAFLEDDCSISKSENQRPVHLHGHRHCDILLTDIYRSETDG